MLPLEHLRWFSLEEERVVQQSSVSISLSFENQCINPVGGYARVPRTCTKQINPRDQRGKGLSIPTRSLTRVRSHRYDKIIFLVFLLCRLENKDCKINNDRNSKLIGKQYKGE